MQKRMGFLYSEQGWATCILTGLLMFGSYGIFIKLNQEISPFTFLFFMQVVGLVSWWLFHKIQTPSWKRSRLSREEKWYLFLFAVVAIGNDLSFFYAMQMTSIANAVLAHQMVSIVMFFLAPKMLGEKRRGRETMALVLSIVGLLVIYWGADKTGGSSDLLGITLGLLSAIFLAFLIIFYKLLTKSGVELARMNTYRFLWSVGLLLPLTLVPDFKFGIYGTGEVVTVGIFGFLFAFVASGIHNWGISNARGMVSTILGKMEPVIAATYAYWILGERISATTLIGGIVIVGSSIWLAFGGAKEKGETSGH